MYVFICDHRAKLIFKDSNDNQITDFPGAVYIRNLINETFLQFIPYDITFHIGNP